MYKTEEDGCRGIKGNSLFDRQGYNLQQTGVWKEIRVLVRLRGLDRLVS